MVGSVMKKSSHTETGEGQGHGACVLRTLCSIVLAHPPAPQPQAGTGMGPWAGRTAFLPVSLLQLHCLLGQVISDLLLALVLPFPRCLLPGPTLTPSTTSPAEWTSTDCMG